MILTVPTIYCEVLITQGFSTPERKYVPGEIAAFPYGIALHMKALGFAGAIKDDLQKHAEAAEALKIYGADAWFEPGHQTISRVADYLRAREAEDEDEDDGGQERGDAQEENRRH